MQHQEFEAPKELRDSIKCFWYDRRNLGEQQMNFEVVPDGYAEIIFYFGSRCSLLHYGELQLLPSPFLIGLLNQPIHFSAKNLLEIIGIKCYPWAVFDLLGLPSGKDGVRTFDHPIAELQPVLEDLMNTGKIEDAIDRVKKYFVDANFRIARDSMLAKAGVAMREANGTMQVGQVAAAAHSTIRTLERKFRQASGHTVKDVSGLIRFEQVRNHLWIDPCANLAGLAHELGYTDQSHLSREFKRYSGITPATFARNAKKILLINDIIAFK